MGSCKFFEAEGRHGLDNKEVFFQRYIIVYLFVFIHMDRELSVCLSSYMYTHKYI